MLIPITNKMLVSGLEYTTVSIDTLKIVRDEYFDDYMKIISWYHNHEDIDANTAIYKKWSKITELLGYEPVSQPTYSHRNALWAFNWLNSDNVVLIYYDVRGMKIQVNENINETELQKLLNILIEKLT